MNIHHARHTIEPKTVELVLFHIKPKVAQQKSQHFVRGVVEKSAVPEVMPTFTTLVKVKVVRAVKFVQTIEHILACVRMNDIEENSQTHAMSHVYEFFEFFRSSVSRTRGKETGNLVSEGCVRGVPIKLCYHIRK